MMITHASLKRIGLLLGIALLGASSLQAQITTPDTARTGSRVVPGRPSGPRAEPSTSGSVIASGSGTVGYSSSGLRDLEQRLSSLEEKQSEVRV